MTLLDTTTSRMCVLFHADDLTLVWTAAERYDNDDAKCVRTRTVKDVVDPTTLSSAAFDPHNLSVTSVCSIVLLPLLVLPQMRETNEARPGGGERATVHGQQVELRTVRRLREREAVASTTECRKFRNSLSGSQKCQRSSICSEIGQWDTNPMGVPESVPNIRSPSSTPYSHGVFKVVKAVLHNPKKAVWGGGKVEESALKTLPFIFF